MNKCGDCVACCEVLKIDEIKKPAYTMCAYCDNGCMIHETKPKSCADFECAWYQTVAPIGLRPDKCGVIFQKRTDKIFTATVLKGREPTHMARAQVENFNKQGISVILVEKPLKASLAKGHNLQEVFKEYRQALWQPIAQT